MKVVSVRVPESLGERDVRLALAVEAFSRGVVSVGKAAEVAELSVWEFLVELKRRGVSAYPYGVDDALEELGFE